LSFKKNISVCFGDEDKEILRYLKTKKNVSAFIKELIQAHMKASKNILSDEMRKAILDLVKENFNVIQGKPSELNKVQVDLEMLDAIDNILNCQTS
jgi:hypothetical protein